MQKPAAEGSPALVVEGLSVELGGVRVVDDVSFEARAGEVRGIFGPSGAGKSTLFRVLAGEARPSRGTVRLLGEDVTSTPLFRRARRGLGYVPQTPSVLFDLTAHDNLRAFAALAPAFSLARGLAIAETLGLTARLDVRASALSGGERRKLELTRALAAAPRVLLCDEPFAALDPETKVVAAGLLRAAADAGACVILADHDIRQALPICDRAWLLLAGKIHADAPPELFQKDPGVRAHYVALP